jgi:hypothetical protein
MVRILKRGREQSAVEHALAAADDLISANRQVDAIRRLTDANRVQRDGRLERRLVQLRLDAFRQMEWSRSQPIWPEVVDDLFPGELIPEVGREKLTVECVRSAIRNHGSLLVRGLVDPEHVDRLIKDIDTTFEAFDALARGDKRADIADWYVPVKIYGVADEDRTRKRNRGGHILAVESPPTLFDLIEIFHQVGVAQLAHDYFGEPPMILARKVSLRRMAHNASGAWHQDGAFMGEAIRSLNVWLALTHCGDDAPSLDVVGRRLEHIVPPGGASKVYAVSPETAEHVGAGAIVRPVFEPGDALIFDHLCLHRTGRDPSMTNGRYATETWLFAPSTYTEMTTPADGYYPDDQVPLVF